MSNEEGPPEDEKQKVGPGKPPKEHKWKPGHCPNPNGRRGKQKEEPMKIPVGPSGAQTKLLKFAKAIMGTIDGEEVDTLDGIHKTMRSQIAKKPEYAKLLLQAINEASEVEEKRKTLLLAMALAHKDEWGEKFALARKMKQPEPAVYPHPDDIIIHHDGSVTFEGPVTKDDARKLKELIEWRDKFFAVITAFMTNCVGDPEDFRPTWLKARRQYYRVSPQIPKRLKKPFPAFAPRNETLDECDAGLSDREYTVRQLKKLSPSELRKLSRLTAAGGDDITRFLDQEAELQQSERTMR